MKQQEKGRPDYMIFESIGRKVYANNYIIGIDPDLNITEGYDGDFGSINGYFKEDNLTKEELMELSEYMINLWTKFKLKYS